MPRSKLKKFKEIKSRKNVIETDYPGKLNTDIDWSSHFGNDFPIILELACGNGEYTNGLASLNPNKNYIGLDVKGERIWQGSTDSINKNLTNTAFLRCQIDHLTEYFKPVAVDEIWIIHPDPFLKASNARKRLTSSKFLEIYRKISKPNTIVHLKTDSYPLYISTLETLSTENIIPEISIENLYKSDYLYDHHNITTRFEQKALDQGGQIYYIKFTLLSQVSPNFL
jgi:tRNA (guanine-N7-)-methyltransferase